MEYIIIEHAVLKEFIDLVNAAIAEGWRPQGGVGVIKGWSDRYTQAMVREHA
jgi:hypothetical protein